MANAPWNIPALLNSLPNVKYVLIAYDLYKMMSLFKVSTPAYWCVVISAKWKPYIHCMLFFGTDLNVKQQKWLVCPCFYSVSMLLFSTCIKQTKSIYFNNLRTVNYLMHNTITNARMPLPTFLKLGSDIRPG